MLWEHAVPPLEKNKTNPPNKQEMMKEPQEQSTDTRGMTALTAERQQDGVGTRGKISEEPGRQCSCTISEKKTHTILLAVQTGKDLDWPAASGHQEQQLTLAHCLYKP